MDATQEPMRQLLGVYRRRVGEFLVTAVNDGAVAIPSEAMVGIDPQGVAETLTASFRPPQPLVTVGTYLIEYRGSRTLVDTGAGKLMGPSLGKVVANLRALGIAPEQIDRVVLTHLHPDHAGGMLDDAGNAVFAAAELVLPREEEAHWLGGEPPTDALGISAQVNAFAPQLRRAYAKGWRSIGQSEEVLPGMHRVALAGHTPGHSGYRLASGGEQLLIWGDIVHVPTIQIANPEVGLAFDVDVEQGRATRRRILDEVATDRIAIGGMHLEFPGFGHVVRSGGSYEYVADLWLPEI